MTQQQVAPRLQRHNQLANRADEVIAAFVAGDKLREMSERFGASIQALTKFRGKHQAEIDALKAKTVERIQDVTLREKEARIRNYDAMIKRIDALVEQRGGLEAVVPRWLGPRETGQVVELRKFDAPLVQQWLNLHEQIAKELGDIPRSPDKGGDTYNMLTLVRYIEGQQE